MSAKRITNSSTFGLSLLVVTCFFFSGISGLIYEILWTRMTVSVVGGAPFAVATILTIFMGGLGLGSYLASRKIDNVKQPLKLVRLYGILELLIGLYGVVLPLLLIAFKPLFAVVYNRLFDSFMLYNLVTFVACAILLIIPVTLMGATLPILCRFYVTRMGHLGTHTGRLYGLNTIGAAVGSLLCGFWLISLFGIWGTLAVAVLINAVIGLFCLVVSRKSKRPEFVHGAEPPAQQGAASKDKPHYNGAIGGALILFAVSGFCAMAYEVIWTKLLGLIVGPTTYSFTIVLVTFIVGLALGSMFFGWWADRTRNTVRLLIGTQIAAGLFALGVSQILGGSQLFFAKLIFEFQDEFAVRTAFKAASLFVLMILPTLCLGATFPLVGKIYTQSIARVGRSIGVAYAINTIGAVLGSFAAGFILIPLIGKEHGLSLVVGLQLTAAVAVALVIVARNSQRALKWWPVVVFGLIGIILCTQYPHFDRRQLSLGKAHRVNEIGSALRARGWVETLFAGQDILDNLERGELVYYGDGIGGFTSVLKYQYQLGDTYFSMANSGKVDASTRGDMRTQTLLAHFPMLFHPSPRSVMVLGLASGVTAGEVLHYPVNQVDVIEINKEVVAASDYFREWNNNLLSDSRTNLIIQDGRAHLGLTEQMYDVIISEPSNPWVAGLATLFTHEFFALAEEHLNRDGIFVQFIHSYQMDWPTFSLVGRTFAQVFPHNLMVSTSPSGFGPDYLLVGFKGDVKLDLDVARRNLDHASKSKNIKLSDPALLYRMILDENMSGLFGSGPVHSDITPILEFAAPKLLYKSDGAIQQRLAVAGKLSDEASSVRQQVESDIDLQIDFAEYALSVHTPFPGMVNLEEATEEQVDRYLTLMDSYFASHSLDPTLFGDASLARRWQDIQMAEIERNIDSLPDKALSYAYLGDLYDDSNRLEEAAASYLRALQYRPGQARLLCNLGAILTKQGRYQLSIKRFSEALASNPGMSEAHSGIGFALAVQGKVDEAVEHFEEALAINPRDVKAHYNLGLTLARQGDADQAVYHFAEAVRYSPYFPDAHCNLAVALTQQGQYDEAISHFEEALRLRPDFQAAQDGMERAQFLKRVRDGSN